MTPRSTAGVGLVAPQWLPQIADEFGPGPTFCVAGAVCGNPAGADLYGAPLRTLAQFARVDERRTLRPCLSALTAAGFLDIARRGGGRGRATLFRLDSPALFSSETLRGEHPLSQAKPGVGNTRFGPDSRCGEHPQSSIPGVENTRFGVGGLPIEALTTTTGGGGDDFVVEADVLAVVLATLPAELRPRTARQRMQMAADIARWMGAGWTAAGIGQRARQGLKPGQVKYPDKLLAQLIPPEPPGPTGIVSSRPPARCPEHLADEPCRGCVIDRQLAERAAARGLS